MVGLNSLAEVIELAAGTSRVLVCPGIGGSIARFSWRGRDILRTFSDAPMAEARVREMGCYSLVPYSNRIEDARLRFQGMEFRLRANFPPEPHSIHGVGWQRSWATRRCSQQDVALALKHEPDQDWPFRFEAHQNLRLDDGELTVGLALINRDFRPMPAGLGFHPFFPLAPEIRLETVWKGAWGAGADGLPTDWEPLTPESDFRQARPIGTWTVDRCFTGWSRLARLEYPDRRVAISASAGLDHMVCYVPASRSFIALEPVSHVNNAFALCARGTADTGARVLAPGETMQVTMTITVDEDA